MARTERFFKVFNRTFDVFYDRSQRSWVAQEINERGEQVNSAQFAPSRDMALIYVGLEASR